MDRSLRDRLDEAIEENLQNEQFSVTELANAAGLSKSQLNRKSQSFTGQSAGQLNLEVQLNYTVD